MSATPPSSATDLAAVAQSAVRLVEDGTVIGLGTGRAAEAFIRALSARVASGLNIRGVATSTRSSLLAAELGVPLTTLDEVDVLSAAFDGADEVAPDLSLTKGLGGALVRERVVACASRRLVILVGADKLVARLGTRSPIPVEVVPFARVPVARALSRLGAVAVARTAEDGRPFVTDNGNPILDARFAPIDDPAALEAAIRRIPGVVDTGLFVGLAERVLVGEAGAVRELVR